MSKEVLLQELLSLPETEQQEIFEMLRARWGDDLALSEEQEQELDRRLDRIEKEGFHGDSWENVEKRLKERFGGTRPSH